MGETGQKAPYGLKVFLLTLGFLVRATTKFRKKDYRRTAKQIFAAVIQAAPEDGIAIDCGANVGAITGLFLERGLRVYAFEPDPVASERLLAQYGQNPNLVFHPVAVGIASSQQLLYRRKEFEENPEYWTMSSSLLRRKVCDDRHSIEVEVVDFIEFLQGIPERISILKMDIEGAEVGILEKLLDTGLHNKIDFIFVETHGRISLDCAFRTARIRARIQANGFSHFNLDHN